MLGWETYFSASGWGQHQPHVGFLSCTRCLYIHLSLGKFAKLQIISKGLNFPYFLAKRITISGGRTFSKLIVRVAVGAIAIGLAAMLLAVAVLNGFKHEVAAKQRGFFGDVNLSQFTVNQSFENVPFTLNSSRIQDVLAIPGVNTVQPYATKAGIINVNGEVEGVIMKGIDSLYKQDFLASILTEGSVIDFADSVAAQSQILISRYTANRLRLSVGDDFIMYFIQERIRPRKFVISGIFNTSAEELDKTYVVGSLSLIRRLNDWGEMEVGGYEVRIDDFEQLATATEEINDVLPINVDVENIRDRMSEIFQWLDLLDANPRIILALMMIVSVINMVSALLIMILERTTMIGVLKALGYTNGGIRQVFLYNSAYLIGIGLLLGNLIGLGLYYFQLVTRFFKLDEASYYVSYIPVQLSWLEVIVLNVGVLAIALLVLLIPSYLISKISPIKAIQFK